MAKAPNQTVIKQSLLSWAFILYLPCLFLSGGANFAIKDAFEKQFKPYLSFLGLYNPYRFFSPDPLQDNIGLYTLVHYADGSELRWDLPQFLPERTSDLEHQRVLVYFYWQYLQLVSPENQVLWPDTCRYAARLHNTRSSPPQTVELFKTDQQIALPKAPSGKTQTVCLLQYRVQAEDLK